MSDDRNLETLPNEGAVEVVLLWGGAAQKADLYRGDYKVRVGDDGDTDFVVPTPAFTLVEPAGADELAIELPADATGAFATAIGRVDVTAWPVGTDGMRRGTVPRMAQGLVHVGTVDFLIRGVAETERLAAAPLAPRLRDVRWGGVSFLAHAAVIAGMLLVPPTAMSLSLDNDQLRARMIQASMAPSETVQDPEPQWLQGPQQGGMDGQPSQGDEGAAGNPESRQKNKRMTIKGRPDNDEPRIPQIGREERARTAGILQILQGPSSPLGHLYGDPGAEGRDLQTLWGNVTGAEPGEAFGSMGLGMQGTGRGGCPIGQTCTALGTVGVGNSNLIGTIGGCSRERLAQLIRDVGRSRALDMCQGGQGGPGTGPILANRPHADKAPDVRGVARVTSGALSREQVRRTVRLHMNEVRFCYEQALQSNPDLDGRVVVAFVIHGRGNVMSSVVASSTLGATPGACVARAISRWSFPATESGGVTSVTYPFTFTHPQ